MKTTGKISVKPYKCSVCGYIYKTSTNHWGAIYNTRCKGCGQWDVDWECQEKRPEGFGIPTPWKKTTIDELCEIITIKKD